MLKNTFYRYGKVTSILTYTIFLIVGLLYLFKGINEISSTNYWEELYYMLIIVLFFVLIIKFFWYLINKNPLTRAVSKIGEISLNLNTILLYLVLFIFCITTVFEFIANAYYQFELDINNKIDYKLLDIKLIPFCVIKLIGYITVTYTSLDIVNVKFLLCQVNRIFFVLVMPTLYILYFIQVRYYNSIKRANSPEIFG